MSSSLPQPANSTPAERIAENSLATFRRKLLTFSGLVMLSCSDNDNGRYNQKAQMIAQELIAMFEHAINGITQV